MWGLLRDHPCVVKGTGDDCSLLITFLFLHLCFWALSFLFIPLMFLLSLVKGSIIIIITTEITNTISINYFIILPPSDLVTVSTLKGWGARSRSMLKKLEGGLMYITHSGVEGGGPSGRGGQGAGGQGGEGSSGLSGALTAGRRSSLSNESDRRSSEGNIQFSSGTDRGVLLGFGSEAIEIALKKLNKKYLCDTLWGRDSMCNGEKNSDGTPFTNDLKSGNEGNQNSMKKAKSVSYIKKDPPLSVNYHLISRSYTTQSGICRAKIPVSGSYIIKIVSKGNAPYTSNVIRIDQPYVRTLYVTALKPAMLRVVLSAILPINTTPKITDVKSVSVSNTKSNRREKYERKKKEKISRENSFRSKKKNEKNMKVVKNKRLPYEINEYGCLMSLINILTGERHLIALSAQQTITRDAPLDPTPPPGNAQPGRQ